MSTFRERVRLLMPSMVAGLPTIDLFRPRDAPRGHASGCDPDRVLLIGAGPAVGWGVTTHELALPGALARALAVLTDRGCDVDLIAEPGMDFTGVSLVVNERDLLRYDAVVLMVGMNEALRLTAVHKWCSGMSSVLSMLRKNLPVDSEIIVVGASPLRSLAAPGLRVGALKVKRALMLDRATFELCAKDQRVTFLSLPGLSAPSSKNIPESLQYVQWANVIGETLAPRLTALNHLDGDRRHTLVHRRTVEADRQETDRQEVVDELHLLPGEARVGLQRIVSLVKQVFNAECALITVLDHDRMWYLARAGAGLAETTRAASFCDLAILGNTALVVRDTRDDDRFRDNPLVVGDPHIRFYAGFPIESRLGQRIGSLCVIDSQPRRRADDVNVAFLREFAHLAERELWKYLPNVDEGKKSRG
ncbi:GAF domain-containing protein [Cryobacterium sp. Y57]|uniref:GAF domain-containing protein n=1 Tax=Cryobacterium sp. Y57 TaxID=2048287 RepID=UPI001304A657|nr:GAF domain-containing protein [Cryobacterium sp. Y57]